MSAEVQRARDFAIKAHGEQRYGDRPYAFHLDMVATILAPFGEPAQVIGYLHDVAEDTSVPLDRVRAEFGDLVAECVALVTDSKEGDRAARKRITNAKLAKVSGPAKVALIVKAADRLANLRVSAQGGAHSKLDQYRREHPDFRRAAHRAGLCDALWNEMDRIVGHAAP